MPKRKRRKDRRPAAIVGAFMVAASPSPAAVAETGGDPAIEFAQASEPTTDQEAAANVTPNPNRSYGGKAATAASSDSSKRSVSRP